MLYVVRDAQGKISEMHPTPVGETSEALPADNPEVLQFIHERWRQNELSQLDRDFVRVIEDTIELLIAKGVILFTDLPPKVQEKFLMRKEVRQRTAFGSNLGRDDDIIRL